MSAETKKSDTTPERYVHVVVTPVVSTRVHHATLFARQNPDGDWTASIAYMVNGDQFNKEVGRKIARRKWFTQPNKRFPLEFFQGNKGQRSDFFEKASNVIYQQVPV